MILILNSHSLIDVITNSSSELFICETKKLKDFVGAILQPIYDKDVEDGHTGGMGGHFEIMTISEYYETADPKRLAVYLADELSDYGTKPINRFPVDEAAKLLEKNLLFIDIDWTMTNTISAIKENFNPIKQFS